MMQGNIIVSTENGDHTFPYNQENHDSLISQLSEQHIRINKLIFENIDAQPAELSNFFQALKSNRTVTDIKFSKCHIDSNTLKTEIYALVEIPIEALTKTADEQENNSAQPSTPSSQPDPRSALSLSRNHTLKQVSIDGKDISHLGLDVNKDIIPWNPASSEINDLYRYMASYYLSLAKQFNIRKQFANAFNFAIYGKLRLNQIPPASQTTEDHRTAIKFELLLGDLHAKKEIRDLSKAKERYCEANSIEEKIPENERVDENWRNLLVINSSIAKITDDAKVSHDASNALQHVISALSSFCHIKEKTISDFNLAADAAKLISNIGSAVTSFIYHIIFNGSNSPCNIDEKINDAKQEMRSSKSEKMRDLLIELLIFTLREESSKFFSSPLMIEYLKTPTNKNTLEKMLVDLAFMEKSSNEPTSDDYTSTETPKIKKIITNYYNAFFEMANKKEPAKQPLHHEPIKPYYA